MKGRLESVNIFSFVINGMIGIRLITLPSDVVHYAKNNGWISILLIGILSMFTGYIFYYLCMEHPGLNQSEICEKIFGKIFGKLLLVVIGLYITVEVGLSLRLFAESISLFLLEKTPTIIIIVVMLISAVYCIKQNIKTISIVLDILTPFILLSLLLLFAFAARSADVKNIMPVFYGGIAPIFRGSLQVVDPMIGIGITGYILPYFLESQKTLKWIYAGFGVSLFIYFLAVIICIMSFGAEEMDYFLFPTLMLARSIGIQAEVLQRGETLFMAAWIPITFTTVVIYYFAAVLNLKALFNTKKDDIFIFGLLPVIFIIALYPKNIAEIFKYFGYNTKLALVLNFIYLPIIMLITIWKQRGENN